MLENLDRFLLAAPVLLFSMVAHEYAHGYAALKQGDPTAYQLGRLTWNPIKHIDPFMTVILPWDSSCFSPRIGRLCVARCRPTNQNLLPCFIEYANVLVHKAH